MHFPGSPVLQGRISWRALVLFLYAGSGFTALIYQMIWTRYLKLMFGSTSLAVASIVASFMAGLALGSYLVGTRIDRVPRALRLYAFMEIGIGIYAVLFPFFFPLLEFLYLALPSFSGEAFLGRSLVRFALSFCFLVVPTFLMGGTFPVICRFYVRTARDGGIWVGRLYGLNTFGAVLGVLLGGLFLPIWLGLRDGLIVAGLFNILIGYLALLISRRTEPVSAGRALTPKAEPAEVPAPLPFNFWIIALALLGSGLAALSYEMLWVRVLGTILGSSIYAFTLILAVYLAGLALGSWLYSQWPGRRRPSGSLFASIQFSIGFLAVLTFPLVNELPYWVARYIAPLNFSFPVTQLLYAAVVIALILLATLFMGASTPCGIHIVSTGVSDIGRRVGILYGLNTVGSIIGAFATGFFLIPSLGIKPSLLLMASVNIGIGLLVLWTWQSAPIPRYAYLACTALFAGFLVLMPPLDEHVLIRGTFMYSNRYKDRLYNRELYEHTARRHELIFYRDGLSTSVAVLDGPEARYLTVNAKVDASTNRYDMSTQTLLGHLPLLLHGEAKEVLIIGLGSGVTLSSALDFPVERVTQVEIEREVIEAARYFESVNQGALNDPKANIVVEDGRNYLLADPGQYDVIISEPSNPWMAGVANLFSKENFELMKQRLAPQGLACQWLQLYTLHPNDVRMVIRTFYSVFPDLSVFQTSPGDILLIGAREGMRRDLDTINSLCEQNPKILQRLEKLGFPSARALLDWSFRLDGGMVAALLGKGGRIHTDNRPYLEFSAPTAMHESYLPGILKELSSFSSGLFSETSSSETEETGRHYLELAQVHQRWEDSVRAGHFLRRAAGLIPHHSEVQLELAKTDFEAGRAVPAIERLETILKEQPNHRRAAFHLARYYQNQGLQYNSSILVESLAEGTDDVAIWALLQRAYWEEDPAEKLTWIKQAYHLDRENLHTLQELCDYYRLYEDEANEMQYLEQTIHAHANHHPSYTRLGEIALERNELLRAKDFLLTALSIEPMNATAHALLANVYLALGEHDLANREYLRSFTIR